MRTLDLGGFIHIGDRPRDSGQSADTARREVIGARDALERIARLVRQ